MKTPAIKQFKLTNDDEIICEVLEWDSDDNSAMIMRAPLRLLQGEDVEKGVRFFAFRPWMGFADNPELLHTVNASHIIGEVTPSEALLKHYASTIAKLLKFQSIKKTDFDMDEMGEMDDDELEDYIQYHLNKNEEESEEDLGENVVRFKPKDTMH
tara:strand:+ start:4584 stop:5048 length:465 start_codon:yes stop_codon:yes gene_type:complete